MSTNAFIRATAVAIGLILVVPSAFAGKDLGNIVNVIVSAPVVPNGIVADEPTEFNVLLNAPLVIDDEAFDPDNFGHQIPAGGRMEVELGGAFIRNPGTTVLRGRSIIITSGPQNPIRPPGGGCVTCGNWSVIDSGSGLITITPNGGNGRNGLEGERAKRIGFKVIHVRPDAGNRIGNSAFTNGPEGSVGTVAVRIYDANGHVKEEGFGDVVFAASVGPQVHLTNDQVRDDNSVVSLSNFQHVAPHTALVNTTLDGAFANNAPYAPRFLLFDALENQVGSFIPFAGLSDVAVEVDAGAPWTARLMQYGTQIGTAVIAGPSEDSRGVILETGDLSINRPNGSILSVPIQVGSERGSYVLTVTLNGGGSAANTTVVN